MKIHSEFTTFAS